MIVIAKTFATLMLMHANSYSPKAVSVMLIGCRADLVEERTVTTLEGRFVQPLSSGLFSLSYDRLASAYQPLQAAGR
jgi:hypothetical protein